MQNSTHPKKMKNGRAEGRPNSDHFAEARLVPPPEKRAEREMARNQHIPDTPKFPPHRPHDGPYGHRAKRDTAWIEREDGPPWVTSKGSAEAHVRANMLL